jgi:hypothetical protein
MSLGYADHLTINCSRSCWQSARPERAGSPRRPRCRDASTGTSTMNHAGAAGRLHASVTRRSRIGRLTPWAVYGVQVSAALSIIASDSLARYASDRRRRSGTTRSNPGFTYCARSCARRGRRAVLWRGPGVRVLGAGVITGPFGMMAWSRHKRRPTTYLITFPHRSRRRTGTSQRIKRHPGIRPYRRASYEIPHRRGTPATTPRRSSMGLRDAACVVAGHSGPHTDVSRRVRGRTDHLLPVARDRRGKPIEQQHP